MVLNVKIKRLLDYFLACDRKLMEINGDRYRNKNKSLYKY